MMPSPVSIAPFMKRHCQSWLQRLATGPRYVTIEDRAMSRIPSDWSRQRGRREFDHLCVLSSVRVSDPPATTSLPSFPDSDESIATPPAPDDPSRLSRRLAGHTRPASLLACLQ